jgi:hypothetical protein
MPKIDPKFNHCNVYCSMFHPSAHPWGLGSLLRNDADSSTGLLS